MRTCITSRRELTAHGIDLREARVVSDDQAGNRRGGAGALCGAYDHVFTSGGIGPTHDDITADCIAEAFGAHIDVRDDAKAILLAFIEARGVEATPARMRMARIPDGATLIDNPVSVAPGFSLENVHVMAGVPKVFEAMLASVLPTLTAGDAAAERRPCASSCREGDIAAPLAELAGRYPDLSIGSYPYNRDGAFGANIVVRGHDGAAVSAAMTDLARLFPEATA